MKALMGTAAVMVIITCGYFLYADLQTKAAAAVAAEARAERIKYLNCRENLNANKGYLKKLNKWHGTTHEERMKAFADIQEYNNYGNKGEDFSGLFSMVFDQTWQKCGPIE